jgi:hypothetical protein
MSLQLNGRIYRNEKSKTTATATNQTVVEQLELITATTTTVVVVAALEQAVQQQQQQKLLLTNMIPKVTIT